MESKMAILALALAVNLLVVVRGYDIDCDSMDISSNKPPLASSTFPHQLKCTATSIKDIEIEIFAADGSPFTGIMLQVHHNGQPVGFFKTRSAGIGDGFVGKDYKVACGANRAQISVDESEKKYALANWVPFEDDVDVNDVVCVATVIESESRRWVQITASPEGAAVNKPATEEEIPLPKPKEDPVKENHPYPVVIKKVAPKKPAPQPPKQAPVSQDRGSIRVNGFLFPSHCNADGYSMVPMFNRDCSSYMAVTGGKPRAVQHCSVGNCFDASQCVCKPCSQVNCKTPRSGREEEDLNLDIYDNSDRKRGRVEWSRKRQPGLTAGFSETQNYEGDLNPIGINERPEYGTARGSTVNRDKSGHSGREIYSGILNLLFGV